jgi:hypothetical protein
MRIERAMIDTTPDRSVDGLAERRQQLLTARAEALMDGDAEAAEAVRQEIAGFNNTARLAGRLDLLMV